VNKVILGGFSFSIKGYLPFVLKESSKNGRIEIKIIKIVKGA
jgi:hypothetical protein